MPFEYFESCDFSCENTNIDVSVFIFDLRKINMLSECEYDWDIADTTVPNLIYV
jgi:hypothetical protein